MRLGAIIFLLSIFPVFGQQRKVERREVPAWVTVNEPKYDKMSLIDQASSFYYVLLDRQYNLDNDSFYSRRTIKLLNSEGVQEYSNVSFSFDPSYEKVFIHTINIIRDGKVIDKLKTHSFNVYQRESNLERHMYDGSLTASVDLSDVRPGDILDFSYSYVGSNPVNEGTFYRKLYFEFSSPIEEINLSVSTNSSRKLNIQREGILKESKSTSNGKTTYQWNYGPVKAKIIEDNVPNWHDPYSHVEIGDFDQWKQVINWGEKLYRLPQSKLNQLKAEIPRELYSNNQDSTITRIIRFVQDDIRYLGFEDGMSAYKPHDPIQVLENRYGDCKDKSLLLSSMLTLQGIDAKPMLVSMANTVGVENDLPSQMVFDHCIVCVRHNGKEVYIDPTISNQGGNWDEAFVPNYGFGLVIDKSETDLKKLNVNDRSKTEVLRRYVIEKMNGPAKLIVTTDAYAGDADNIRSYFQSSSKQQIAQGYLEFQSNIYPSIKIDQEMIYRDDLSKGDNHIFIEESYIIDSIFYIDEDNKGIIVFDTYPSELYEAFGFVSTPERTMPYRLSHPVDFYLKTIVEFPEPWSLEKTTTHEDNKFYTYDMEGTYSRLSNQATIKYHYQTKQDFVPAADYLSFRNTTENIIDYLGFSFTYGYEAPKNNNDDENGGGGKFPYTLLALLIVGGGFAWYNNYKKRYSE